MPGQLVGGDVDQLTALPAQEIAPRKIKPDYASPTTGSSNGSSIDDGIIVASIVVIVVVSIVVVTVATGTVGGADALKAGANKQSVAAAEMVGKVSERNRLADLIVAATTAFYFTGVGGGGDDGIANTSGVPRQVQPISLGAQTFDGRSLR